MDHATVPGNSSSSLSSISSPHHKQPTPSMEQWIGWSSGGHFKEVDGKVHQRWEAVELQIIAVSCNPWFPAPFHHHLKPSQGGNWGLHFLRSLHQLGRLWKVPGFDRNSSNDSWVLPPATAWILNQDSLFSSRKYMEMSGRQEQLINLPENQILIG